MGANLTEAEAFQLFLAEQVVASGRSKSPEELVQLWRQRQVEQDDAATAINEGIADVEAGRVHDFAELNEEIRRKHGWSAS